MMQSKREGALVTEARGVKLLPRTGFNVWVRLEI